MRFLATLLVLFPILAFANSEYVVRTESGQDPYLIVVEDKTGASTKEPGVYGRDAGGAWKLLMLGHVVGGQTTGGVLAHLGLTQLDGRYQTVVIVDGEVRIFHLNTQPNTPKSFISVGGAQAPVHDLFFPGRVIHLPTLTSSDDVSIAQAPVDSYRKEQALLVSMRLPYPTLQGGNGITLLLMLKAAEDPKSSQLELVRDPVVIDYQFQSEAQLRRLWIQDPNRKGTRGVLSRMVLEHFSASPPEQEPLAVQDWREDLRVLIEKLLDRGEPFDPEKMFMPPYLDLETGTIKAGALPTFTQPLTRQIVVTQVYDPVAGQQGVYIGEPRESVTPHEFTFWGKIDRGEDGRYQLFTKREESSWSDAALIYINGQLYFVVGNSEDAAVRVYDQKIEKPEKLSFFVKTQEIERQTIHTLFISGMWKGRMSPTSETHVFVIQREPASKTLKVVKAFGLAQKFYEEFELASRVHEMGKELFFDTITPPQKSEEAYNQAYDDTVIHLNVSQSGALDLVTGYLKAKKEISVIASHVLDFRAFNETGTPKKETGLYLRKSEGGDKEALEVFPGNLLIPSWGLPGASKDKPFLFSEEVDLPAIQDKGQLYAVAYDPSFRQGEEGFSLLLVLVPHAFSKKKFAPVVLSTPFHFPMSLLKSALLFSGKKKSADQLTLFITIDTPAQTYPFSLQVQKGDRRDDVDQLAFRVTYADRLLVQQALLPSEILARLIMDEAGRLYWISDPKKNKGAADYTLLRLYDGHTMMVNSAEGRTLSLVPLTDAKDGDPQAAARFSSANWRLFGRYGAEDLGRLFDMTDGLQSGAPGKEKEDEPQRKRWKASVHQRMGDFFPGLTSMLHELSDPSQPAQHRVVLVPQEQHSLLMGYIFKLWMDEKGSQAQQYNKTLPEDFRWSVENDNLKVYYLRHQTGGQDDILANFSEMSSLRSTERAVVIMDMDQLIHTGRPGNRMTSDQEPFMISSTLTEGETQTPMLPHILYWLATEGQKIPIERFAKLSPQELGQKVSILLMGSRKQWDFLMKQTNEGAEAKAGLLAHFSDTTSYFHGTWRVWGPNTTLTSPLVQSLVEKGISKYREEVFPELEAVLREISEGSQSPRHRVLLVPPEIKDYVRNSIFSRWADPSLAQNSWSHHNTNLRLFHLAPPAKGQDPRLPQDVVFENLDIMKGLSGSQRPVFLSDLSAIRAINRPLGSEAGSFQIQDFTVSEEDGQSLEATPDVSRLITNPHLLYLLATEGSKVSLEEFEAFSQREPKKIPMLLIGTEAEWNRVLEDATIEKRAGIATHFEKVALSVPDHNTRKRMLAQVLARPEIRGLKYIFDPRVPGSDDPEPQDQVKAQDEILAYIVSACERIARENNSDVLTAFLKAFQAFNRAWTRDETTRTRKRIDRIEVQRILAQIFKVQLNPSLLPPNDPLVVLKREDFPLLMQQAGAEGPFEQATRVAKILLKQIEPTPKIPIPASAIIFGESSSGKTRFAYSLLKVLGLKPYDFTNPDDMDAQAFVLNCRKLIDEGDEGSVPDVNEPSGDGVMTVRQALRHLDNFLTLPNGSRGFIIIDDAHAPKDSIRAKIIAKVQSLVGSEDGMWRGRSEFVEEDMIHEVPLQNVALFLIANPTYDQKRVEQFKKDKWSAPTLEELLLASLTTDEQKLDPSFLKRFSGIIQMDTFASEARVPAVLGDTRKGAHQIFSSQNRLILVSPEAAEGICARFPVDARTLLSQVPQALLSKVEGSASIPVHIVVPRIAVPVETSMRTDTPYDERAIEAYVQANIQAFAVTKDNFEGRVELLKYLLGSFRIYLLESLIKSVTRDARFARDPVIQQTTLAPLLHAIKAHLELNQGIRFEDVVLNPRDFGVINTASETDFRRVLSMRDTLKRGFWPKWIFAPTRNADLADLMTMGEKRFAVRDRSRRDVLVETSRMLEAQLKGFMGEYFQVDSIEALPSARAWLEEMKPLASDAVERMGKKLGEEFLDFLFHLHEANLMEVRDAAAYRPITPYDAARFFLLTLDRAISRLPWGALTQFMTSSLGVATQEISLGERPNVQAVFFENRDSFLAARTPELPIQMVVNTAVFKEWRGESTDTKKEERMAQRILDECEQMLSKPDAS